MAGLLRLWGVLSAAADAPNSVGLDSRMWKVQRIASVSVMESSGITLRFSGAGQLRGHAGCNHIRGRYAVRRTRLYLYGLSSSFITCKARVAAQERELLLLLSRVVAYRIEAGSLVLVTGQGDELIAR